MTSLTSTQNDLLKTLAAEILQSRNTLPETPEVERQLQAIQALFRNVVKTHPLPDNRAQEPFDDTPLPPPDEDLEEEKEDMQNITFECQSKRMHCKSFPSALNLAHVTCIEGYIEKYKEEYPEDFETRINAPVSGFYPPLHYAAFNSTKMAVRILVENKADVNLACPPYDETPLHLAAKSGKADIAQFLLIKKAIVNKVATKECRNYSPLMLAAVYKYEDVLQHLIARQANINYMNTHYENALILAQDYGGIKNFCWSLKLHFKYGANRESFFLKTMASLFRKARNLPI